jgi:hypothetical protein
MSKEHQSITNRNNHVNSALLECHKLALKLDAQSAYTEFQKSLKKCFLDKEMNRVDAKI